MLHPRVRNRRCCMALDKTPVVVVRQYTKDHKTHTDVLHLLAPFLHWNPQNGVLGGKADGWVGVAELIIGLRCSRKKKEKTKFGKIKLKIITHVDWLGCQCELFLCSALIIPTVPAHVLSSSRPAARHGFSILHELFPPSVKSLHKLTTTRIINLYWESWKMCRDVVVFQSNPGCM